MFLDRIVNIRREKNSPARPWGGGRLSRLGNEKNRLVRSRSMSGCSLVWLKRTAGGREIGGSNPLTLTNYMDDKLKIFTDGGARGNPGPAAYAFVICKLDDSVVEKSGKYLGETTNNQAEYRALEAGLERALELKVSHLDVYMDSELAVNQLKGLYKVKNQGLLPIFNKIKKMASKVDSVTFTYIPRALNQLADAEVNRILDEQNSIKATIKPS